MPLRAKGAAKRVSLFAPCAAALLLTACGGNERDPRAEFVARGNEICRELHQTLEEIGAPEAAQTERAYFRRQARRDLAARRALSELERLDPPPDLTRKHRALFAAIERQRATSASTADAQQAAEEEYGRGIDGPAQKRLSRLIARSAADQRRVEARFRALEWKDCLPRSPQSARRQRE